jgi:hypothetical protein
MVWHAGSKTIRALLVAKPTEQRVAAIGVSGELAGGARRVKMHAECRFEDNDTGNTAL